MIRFYRVTGFGVLSVILISLLNLIPRLGLTPTVSGYVILVLTSALTAIDKKIRDLKTTK